MALCIGGSTTVVLLPIDLSNIIFLESRTKIDFLKLFQGQIINQGPIKEGPFYHIESLIVRGICLHSFDNSHRPESLVIDVGGTNPTPTPQLP